MSVNITNFGNINYHDNHREYHIDARGNDLASVLHAVDTENITPVQEVKTEPAKESSNLPFLVEEKLKELNLYTLEEFEDMYRKAVKGDAKTLAKFLKNYSDLEVLDFKGKDKKQILTILQERFPDDINYGYTNFATYF